MRFNEKRFAEEYDRRLTDEGYPGNLLDILKEKLKNIHSVIDIGAGTGFFTVPLAKSGYEVHAVEPSPEMIRLMKKRISEDITGRITIYNSYWEEWSGEKREASICIHSIYPMKAPLTAIDNMIIFSNKRVLAVKKPDTETLTSLVKGHFSKSQGGIDYEELVETFLKSRGIDFIKEDLYQDRITRFNSLEEGALYYKYFLKLEDLDVVIVKDLLSEITKEKDGVISFNSNYHDIMYTF